MYLKINHANLFYTKNGLGPPLILLHGNSQDHRIFNKVIPNLSQYYTVYALDFRWHGYSQKTSPLSYPQLAKDIISFIKVLELPKPCLYGFSDGGIVGLMIASFEPDLLSKLMVSGINTSLNGLKKPYYYFYKSLSLVSKNPRLQMILDLEPLTPKDLHNIKIPTLLTVGTNDMVTIQNNKYAASQIPKSSLKILKGEGHSSYVTHSPKLFPLIYNFLKDS